MCNPPFSHVLLGHTLPTLFVPAALSVCDLPPSCGACDVTIGANNPPSFPPLAHQQTPRQSNLHTFGPRILHRIIPCAVRPTPLLWVIPPLQLALPICHLQRVTPQGNICSFWQWFWCVACHFCPCFSVKPSHGIFPVSRESAYHLPSI